jgi:hypothetical protein
VSARRVALGGSLFAVGALLAVIVAKLWDHDEQLTEHERVLSDLEQDVHTIGEMALRVIP